MKRLFSLCLTLIAGFALLYAAPVKFGGCVPADGSEISSFNFTLNFDVSEAAAGLQDSTWGIGSIGNSTTTNTVLYEGTQAEGKELGKALTKSVTGTSEECVAGGTSVTISFPQFFPEPGKTYTLVVSNRFGLREIGVGGSTKWLNDSKLNLSDNPIVITFTGREAADNGETTMRFSAPAGQYIVRVEKNGKAKAANIIH